MIQLLFTLALAVAPPTTGPQLPQWRDGPPVSLPPVSLPRRTEEPRDLRLLYAIGGLLVLTGLYLYNRKIKATLAAADAADAAAQPRKDPPADDHPAP